LIIDGRPILCCAEFSDTIDKFIQDTVKANDAEAAPIKVIPYQCFDIYVDFSDRENQYSA
jgi:hypothetical protein